MKIMLSALVTLLLTAPAAAQDVDSYIELLRSDIRTEKMEIITDAMRFSDEEAADFWPVYREYQHKLDQLGDEYLAILKDYADNVNSLTAAKAKDLTEKTIQYKKDRLDVQEKYFKRISKLISPIKAARWAQLENQIGLLTELQGISGIPLMEAPAAD